MAVLAPELERGGGQERKGENQWWAKVVDGKEAKIQILFALPMVLTNVVYYLIPLVSVMFAGHLGDLQLAASTLANSWAYVTGYGIMVGLSVALETLCGQAFGAQRYEILGIYLQTSCLISFVFCILISIMWWYTKPILVVLLHQNPEVSKEAAVYMRYLIPGIYAFGAIQNILRFLQTQSVVWPLVICSLIPLLLQTGLAYTLVKYTRLGFRGAALATSVAFWISVVMLLVYVRYAKILKNTWTGFSKMSSRYIVTNLKLALASTAMVCLEYWAFEVVILLAGLLPDSKASTSLVAMCIATQAITYNFMFGLSAAVSTRVSNELGGRRPDRAKHAMVVGLKLSIVLTAIILVTLGLGRDFWAHLFSDNINIIKSFASMTPLLCISLSLDCIQCILSGVSRGSGWQNLTSFINLSTFCGIGIPIACLFAFKLHFEAKGFWIGLICGLASQTVALAIVTYVKKWTVFEQPSNDDIGCSISSSVQLDVVSVQVQSVERLP